MNVWCEKEITISQIKNLLEQDYEIEIDSPDGFVPVSMFVDKGEWEEYCLELEDGRYVRVNENHLFETNNGWQLAKDLYKKQIMLDASSSPTFLCDNGWKHGKIIKTGNKIPIVDIQVDHENHRYYSNGISSHNTGVGKSLFMCHVASACLVQGYNVLYITMEMAEEKIAERIDANLLNVSLDDLSNLPKDVYDKKVEKVRKNTVGKLIIKEYPTALASTTHFRTLLNELLLKKSFRPDIIFIDYLNICCSARVKPGSNINSYTYIKAIAEEIRGLAVEFKVPVISATQTTRSGFSSTDVELTDTSESFGLPATADFMAALISTEELEALNQIMVKQLKNRYNDPTSNKRFVLGIDRAKMRLYDVEQSAQDDILDSGQKKGVDDKFIDRIKSPFSQNKFKTSGLKV